MEYGQHQQVPSIKEVLEINWLSKWRKKQAKKEENGAWLARVGQAGSLSQLGRPKQTPPVS